MADNLPEGVKALVESLVLGGALDAASDTCVAGLLTDAEWTTPKYVHQATLLRSFVQGVLTADPWHHGYRLPPHFEGVVNMVAFEIQKRWPTEVPQVTLWDFEQFLREVCPRHPEFVRWNHTDKLVGIVSRDTPMPDERDFIDLDALYRNAAVALRDDIRQFEAFNRDFEARYSTTPTGEKADDERRGTE